MSVLFRRVMNDPPPRGAPEQADAAEDVEDPLPPDVLGQEAGDGQRDDRAHVAAGEPDCRESAPFEWWCPSSPDCVDGWVSDTLLNRDVKYTT